MEFLPKITKVAEEYVVKNGGVYLVDKVFHTEREVDGNALINYLTEKIKGSEKDVANLEKILEERKQEIAEYQHIINETLTVYKKTPKRLPNGVTEKDENGEFVYEYVKAGK